MRSRHVCLFAKLRVWLSGYRVYMYYKSVWVYDKSVGVKGNVSVGATAASLSMLAALSALVCRWSLLGLAAYLRASPMAAGKRWLLRLCLRLPRSPFATVVPLSCRVRAKLPSTRLRCYQLDSRPHADILSEWLLFTGTWQPALTRWLERRLRPGDTFVDVGANTGYFALLAAGLGGGGGVEQRGGVVAIEACERTMGRLRENVALNPQLARIVRTVVAAAADAPGKTTLYRHRSEPLYSTTVAGAGAGGVEASSSVWAVLQASSAVQGDAGTAAAVSALADDDVWSKSAVEASTVDEILSEQERRSARVIKVDVEGGEWAVLRGMSRVIEQGRPDLELVVELTPRWLRMQGVSAAHVIRHMQALGFNAYKLGDDYEISRCLPLALPPRPRRMKPGEPLGCDQADVIFSREDAEYL